MKNLKYFNAHNVALSLSNLYFRNECSVTAIKDAVEDSYTARDFRDNLNKLKINEKFEIDRVTDKYVRLKSTDVFGNVHYMQADREDSNGLAEYYDAYMDNYVIPIEDMTDSLMKEALNLVKTHPYDGSVGTYLLMLWNDGEGDNWVVTSQVE